MAKKHREPTPQMKAFVDEWLRTGSQVEAYKKVYKNCKNDASAAASACKLLRNPNLQAYKEARLQEIANHRIAGMQEIMEMLTAAMRGELKEETLTADGALTLVAPAMSNRLKAAELLGKRYGMFKDKLEVSGTVNIADTLKKARERVNAHVKG